MCTAKALQVFFSKKMFYDEKLLKSISETGVISLPQMKLVWEVMQEKMLDQLINQQRSIDLGFAEIYPVPYRANWKNGLHDEFKNIGQDFKGKGHDACVEIAKNKGFWAPGTHRGAKRDTFRTKSDTFCKKVILFVKK